MMSSRRRTHFNDQIYAEAADWLVELRSGDADRESRKKCYEWLRTSPEHMRAYLELAAIWVEGGNLPAGQEGDETSWADTQPSNVITLPAQSVASRSAPTRSFSFSWRDRHARVSWAASLMIAVLGAVAWHWYDTHVRGVYITAVGEQYMVRLADGSVVKLNALSKIRVHFDDEARYVDLLRGQAFFQVAHDVSRPFWVSTDNTRVRAVGTQFDVYRKPVNTTVTVVEGKVAVAASTASDVQSSVPTTHGEHEAMLAAGEQLIVDKHALYKPRAPDIAAATAWLQGQLIFKGAALREVAAEFNRYNTRQVVIADPKLGDLEISGIFSSTDPAVLILFLKTRAGIEVRETQTEITVLHKALPASS